MCPRRSQKRHSAPASRSPRKPWDDVTRRALARIQTRIGPNRAGPQGVFQPIADAVKLVLQKGDQRFDPDRALAQRRVVYPVGAKCSALYLAVNAGASSTLTNNVSYLSLGNGSSATTTGTGSVTGSIDVRSGSTLTIRLDCSEPATMRRVIAASRSMRSAQVP